MATPDSPASYARDLVAQIVQDSPERAEALIRFSAITDNSTPRGAAIRLDALLFALEFTESGREALEGLMRVAACMACCALLAA